MGQALGLGIIGWLLIIPAMQISANHNLDWLQTILLVAAMTAGAGYACDMWILHVQKNYGAHLFWRFNKTAWKIGLAIWGAATVYIYYRSRMPPFTQGFYDLHQLAKFLGAAVYAFPVACLATVFLGYIPRFSAWMESQARANVPGSSRENEWQPPTVPDGDKVVKFDKSRFPRNDQD